MAETGSAYLRGRLDIIRCTSTGAFATLLLFLLCWAATMLSPPLAHSFILMFTIKSAASTDALWMGGLSAFIFGGIAGALVAHCYNLAGRILHR